MAREAAARPSRRTLLLGALIALVVAAAVIVAIVVPGEDEGLSAEGEPLTVERSELLAQARFRMSTVEEFTAEVSVGDETATDYYSAQLTVATADHAAWGTLHRGPKNLATAEDLVLTPTNIAVVGGGAWNMTPVGATDFAALPIVFSLVSDRPENAQLLRQSDAAYLGAQSLDGAELDVFRLADENGDAGRTRLWLDADGALKRLDDGGDTLVITVTDGDPQPRPAIVEQVLAASEPADDGAASGSAPAAPDGSAQPETGESDAG